MMFRRLFSLALWVAATASVAAQSPVSVEYFLDEDPGHGAAVTLTNIHVGDNALTFDLSAAKDGAHVLYVRALDSEGRWSTTMSRPLFIDRLQDIVYVEYFFDTDPGRGQATAVPLPDQEYKAHLELSLELVIDHLSLGEHELFVRALDRFDQWSDVLSRRFTIVQGEGPVVPPVAGDLSRIEYFFDADPGYGQGRFLLNPNTGANTYVMDFSGLEAGAHVLYLRAEDTNSIWSATLARPFYVVNPAADELVAIEYYVDVDPGTGHGTALPLPSSPSGNLAFDVPTDALAMGDHQLYVRVCNRLGVWSMASSQPFCIVDGGTGLGSVSWQMNIAVRAEAGKVVLTSRDSGRAEANDVVIYGIDGKTLGKAVWLREQREMTVPVAARRQVLLVKVTEQQSGREFIQRVIVP